MAISSTLAVGMVAGAAMNKPPRTPAPLQAAQAPGPMNKRRRGGPDYAASRSAAALLASGSNIAGNTLLGQ